MRFLRLGNLGMRGVAGTGLTPHSVIAYASAVGTYFNGGRIAVGMDTRISSKTAPQCGGFPACSAAARKSSMRESAPLRCFIIWSGGENSTAQS